MTTHGALVNVPVEFYRYGKLAWLWRLLMAFGLVVGGLCVTAGVWLRAPVLLLVAAPLVLPVLFFGHAVAIRVAREGGEVVVTTLLGTRRRLALDRLGRPRFYLWAQATVDQVRAPRVWIPVRGRIPVYVDLLGQIVDRPLFLSTLKVEAQHVPATGRSRESRE